MGQSEMEEAGLDGLWLDPAVLFLCSWKLFSSEEYSVGNAWR